MTPNTNISTNISPSPEWLVMYSNSGDVSILDDLKHKHQECETTGIWDFFVPVDVARIDVDGKSIERKHLIDGNYIFIKATKEDILRLRQEPPFNATLRFLHPATSPTGCVYIPDSEIEMMRLAVERMDGDVEYFVPSTKELMISDTVCVLEGKFAGIKGVLESVKGHEGGRIIVAVGDVLALRTPRIPANDIQLLEFAKVTDTMAGSYTSRAYKKIRTLLAESERLLEEKEKDNVLSDASSQYARRLVMKFFQLRLSGKIRLMHAQAIYNLLLSLGDTENKLFSRFHAMLP